MVEHRSPHDMPDERRSPDGRTDGATGSGTGDLAGPLQLAERGYHLVPCFITRRPDGKKSARFPAGWKGDVPTVDPDRIRDWWVQHPGCSWAIACGPSGLDVVDLDPSGGGPARWTGLGMPTGTDRVSTPSGGTHLYWRRTGGVDGAGIGTNAGKVGAGIDVRSVNGVTFAPGSTVIGVDGRPEPVGYRADGGQLPKVADLEPTPAAVVELFARHRPAERLDNGETTAHDLEWMAARVAEQRARVRAFDPRTQTGFRELIRSAGLVLGRVADAGAWPGDELAAALEQDAGAVWGAADDDDREWIRDSMIQGPRLERWTIKRELGSDLLAEPATPLGNTPSSEVVTPAVSGVVSGVILDVPAPSGSPENHAQAVELALRKLRVADEARRLFERERRAHDPGPGSTSLTALMAEPDDGPAYLVDQLWPAGGKVLLAAPQKAGKTTLIGNLVRSLADGHPFLAKPVTTLESDDWRVAAAGFAVPAARRVFVLDFEMTRRKLREWLIAQRIVNTGSVHLEVMRGRSWDIRDPAVRTGWAEYLRTTGVTVLIVDPIGPVLHGLGIDENDNSAVGGFLAALDALVLEAGIGELLVVHHTGHGSERARGASSFLGWPDANWRIVREELGDVRGFAAEGRDVWVPETVTEYDRDTRRLWLGQGNRAESRGSADAVAVLEVVRAECADRGIGQDGPSQNQLETLVKTVEGWGSPKTVNAIRSAVAQGLIHVHSGAANRARPHHPGTSCDYCPGIGQVPS